MQCEECSKTFEAVQRTQRYCGGLCKSRARNKRDKENYAAHFWHKKKSPEADRIVTIFDKMGKKQKVRFADWLLKKSHRSLGVFKVDDLVSTYNSEGI